MLMFRLIWQALQNLFNEIHSLAYRKSTNLRYKFSIHRVKMHDSEKSGKRQGGRK